MKIARVFLDWDKPALDRAAEHLTQGWSAGPLDLRDRLIVVPTLHAGRRLRERLAMAAAERGTGVLMGLVETPSFLFRPPAEPVSLAADTSAEIFWRRVLEQSKPGDLTALGPETIATEPAVCAATAAHIRALRDLLCEEGYTLGSFAEACARAARPELARWRCLGELEARYLSHLKNIGWDDDVTAKLRAAMKPVLPPAIRGVTVLFVPDPPPLAIRAIEHLPPSLEIEICVHAPADRMALFDSWGRPVPDEWQRHPLFIDPADVEVCADVITIAERVRAVIAGVAPEARPGLVVGVGDARTAIRVAMTLARDGIGTFDPSGTPAARMPLFTLVDRLLCLRQDNGIESLLELLRHPYALRRIERDQRMENALLAVVDEFQNQQMPVSFDAARETAALFAPEPVWMDEQERTRKRNALTGACLQVERWMKALHGDALAKALPAVLVGIFEDMPSGESLDEEARLLTATLERFAEIEPFCADHAEAADLLRKFLSGQTLPARRRPGDVDLLGWLEMPWEDAPALLLTDLNDGTIPEAVTADPFLPDGARAAMGLRDNRRRFARDAYLLDVLARSRPPGRLRGFVARRGPTGDTLKPSRLLLHGPADDLPRRALRFFSDGRSVFTSVERRPGWLLNGPDPAVLAAERRLSVSSLKVYLQCPFRFYLQHASDLGDPYEPQQEMDPQDFGSFIHEVFAAFAQGDCADSDDPDAIERTLHETLDRAFARRFGSRPGLPLRIQHDVLRQRLTYAARAQAAWRQQGWRIDRAGTERAVEIPIGADTVRARMDRIDVHEATGEVCVMDYKTAAKAPDPETAHLKAPRGGIPPELAFAAAPIEGCHWIDLQLPLYVAACSALYPGAKGRYRAAYFVLPNAVSDTGIRVWEGLDAALVAGARACAERIFRRVRAGVFWPPNGEFADRDAEWRLFFDDIEQHLEPGLVAKLKRAAASFRDGGKSARGKGRT
jgi:ATP-dependent helicase/nuclease subunit B